MIEIILSIWLAMFGFAACIASMGLVAYVLLRGLLGAVNTIHRLTGHPERVVLP